MRQIEAHRPRSAHNDRVQTFVAVRMLAAECAWTILRAEHARIRRLLASVDAALKADDWRRPGHALGRLRDAVQRLRAFDDKTHRPKGVALLAILRGRSAEADDLLEQLERQRERCDDLLSRAMTL